MRALIYKAAKVPPGLKQRWNLDWLNRSFIASYEQKLELTTIKSKKIYLNYYFNPLNFMDLSISSVLIHSYSKNTAIRQSSLTRSCQQLFNPSSTKLIKNKIGEVIQAVWRPGISSQDNIPKVLSFKEYEKHAAQQILRICIQKFEELLLYIEPSKVGLKTYGHKTRELLIFLCTEVENIFTDYIRITNIKGSRYTTKDYVKLCAPLFLKEYAVTIKPFKNIIPQLKPFIKWEANSPTKSLKWYDAYNKTKHDRFSHFKEATLEHCFSALAAIIILFCGRYSPYSLFDEDNMLASLANQWFEVSLIKPDPVSFYIPLLQIPNDLRSYTFFPINGLEYMRDWKINPLVL